LLVLNVLIIRVMFCVRIFGIVLRVRLKNRETIMFTQ